MNQETLNFSASREAIQHEDHGQDPIIDDVVYIRNESPEYHREEVKRPS